MRGNYIKPSELLALQKQTGKSYWDLIGRPLDKKPKDPVEDVVDKYDPVLREALRLLIENALGHGLSEYKDGKSPNVKTWNDNDVADLIIGFEGFLPTATRIGDGKITIGSGLTNPKYTKLGRITKELNRKFVLEEIAARRARLTRRVPGWNSLPASAQAALLSYDYGYMVDKETSPKLIHALQTKDWREAANQMNAGWNMPKFKNGLRKRRTQERNLFLSELYRPTPLKPILTSVPMPKATIPFEVDLMEDRIAPIINQSQEIEIPYSTSVEPQTDDYNYDISENDLAYSEPEYTKTINPLDILSAYRNMFGYKRGKSFPFLFWNRFGNTMRLQKFYSGTDQSDWLWTRVKQTNGKYGYVKTKNDRPVEFSPTTGKFRVYDGPNSNAKSFETSVADARVADKSVGILRTPDDHNAALEKARIADGKVEATAPTVLDFIGAAMAPINFISPSLIYRGLKDTDTVSDYINNVASSNSGFFTGEYAKENPYISTIGNIVGDGLFGLVAIRTPNLFKFANDLIKNKTIARGFDKAMDVNRISSVTNAFRNSEWSNFLATRNGDNYYRLLKTPGLVSTNVDNGSGYFLSHTTPWEEFSGLGSKFPIGHKILYEFPTKTFGKLKSSESNGPKTLYDVAKLGKQHLLYGNTSSGERDFMGRIVSRPLKLNRSYDGNPIYENVRFGYLTTITPEVLNDALVNTSYNVFRFTPNGVLRELFIPSNFINAK